MMLYPAQCASPQLHIESQNHVRSFREQARLSQQQLADLSHVNRHLIRTLEDAGPNQVLPQRPLLQIIAPLEAASVDRVMRQTLVTWAEQFHRLATALEAPFEKVFPADYLAALSDQLWRKIDAARHWPAGLQPQLDSIESPNPWHHWGWFREEPLSEDLVDPEADQPPELDDLTALIVTLTAGLTERERKVLSLHFGFEGRPHTLREIGRQLGLPLEGVQQIEATALDWLKLRHGG